MAATWSAFAVRGFRALWLAGLLSVAGDQLARVALSILVFQRTGSAALSAATYALSMLPALVSGALLSWLADRYPRRRVMVACDVVRAALVAVMAVPAVPLPLMAALLVLVQLAEAPFSAAQGAVLPELLGGRYEAGQAVQQVTTQLCLVLGFAAAAFVVTGVGAHAALAIDAATFAFSALLIRAGLGSHPPPATAESERGTAWWRRIAAGAVAVRRDRTLGTLVWLGWLALFTVVPEGLAVPFAYQVGAGGEWIGVLLAAEPAGAVAGALLLRRVARPVRVRALGVLAVGTSAPLVAFWGGPTLGAALALLFVSGLCSAYQVTAGATFVQLSPPRVRGRTLGFARTGMIAGQGLGVVAGGVLAQLVGPAAAIALAGTAGALVALAAAAAWARRRPDVVSAALPAEA
ncbi:MFS transporter [Amycolatopsis tolypomycina]|uniref:Predicted arabinose efflux permease, MFS family n=1 Tax=Amycolatopsis tolypomycina TaxID=208445 RepID=A0A1H4XFZ0_9PSEU|nr:MFS transporter [Amycolatopsis tolypomycina]SED04536.1 Predicted arabinose efflux permease, MFS family [Amycolatopsis tolypomycina]